MEALPIRVLQDRVIIRQDEPPEKIGSIIVPEETREKEKEAGVTGTVVAMGLGMRKRDGTRRPMPDIRIGQRVAWHPQWAVTTSFGGETLKMVRGDDIEAAFDD